MKISKGTALQLRVVQYLYDPDFVIINVGSSAATVSVHQRAELTNV